MCRQLKIKQLYYGEHQTSSRFSLTLIFCHFVILFRFIAHASWSLHSFRVADADGQQIKFSTALKVVTANMYVLRNYVVNICLACPYSSIWNVTHSIKRLRPISVIKKVDFLNRQITPRDFHFQFQFAKFSTFSVALH